MSSLRAGTIAVSIAVFTVPGPKPAMWLSRNLTLVWFAKWSSSCFLRVSEKSPQLKRCLKSPLFCEQRTAALWHTFFCKTFSKVAIQQKQLWDGPDHTHPCKKRTESGRERHSESRVALGAHLLSEGWWATGCARKSSPHPDSAKLREGVGRGGGKERCKLGGTGMWIFWTPWSMHVSLLCLGRLLWWSSG